MLILGGKPPLTAVFVLISCDFIVLVLASLDSRPIKVWPGTYCMVIVHMR